MGADVRPLACPPDLYPVFFLLLPSSFWCVFPICLYAFLFSWTRQRFPTMGKPFINNKKSNTKRFKQRHEARKPGITPFGEHSIECHAANAGLACDFARADGFDDQEVAFSR